jgi:hypothetical protein
MTKRITDLEKFALEQIWRPYQNHISLGIEKRLEALPMSIEETAVKLIQDETGWSKLVLDRISAIGFRFPYYISHPLVDVVKAAQSSRTALASTGGEHNAE